MGATTFWNSLVLKSKKIALFYITLSVPVSLHLKQITFANDTDSHVKIAKGKQNSWNTKIFTHLFMEENQSNILDGSLMFWKMIGAIQKRGMVKAGLSYTLVKAAA